MPNFEGKKSVYTDKISMSGRSADGIAMSELYPIQTIKKHLFIIGLLIKL